MRPVWPDRNGQFVISSAVSPPPAGATRHSVGTLAVDVFGEVPLTQIREPEGKLVGYLIGIAVDLDAGVASDQLLLDAAPTPDTIDDIVERSLYRLAGSYLFVIDTGFCRRIYLDADGSRSLVYDRATQRAGATAMSLLDEEEYGARLERGLYRTLGVAQAGWFTGDLTAHRGVRRLLCNHYLDLDSWSAVRHWPRQPLVQVADPVAAYDGLMARCCRFVEQLLARGKVSVALTAGSDSRFMLAALRPLADRLRFVTVAAPSARLDVAIAGALAKRFGLDHVVLPYRRASESEAAAWQTRAGHCISGANMYMHPSVEPLRGRFFVGGLGGEVGRGFLWLKAAADTPLDASHIVARLKLPREPRVVAAVEQWLAPIAHLDTLQVLDLAYLELRMCSWAFADAYANPIRTELHPMISRANYTAMLSVPAELRRDATLFREAIGRAWPELLELPINRYGDWRDARKRTLDVVTNPGRAMRKVKQLVFAG